IPTVNTLIVHDSDNFGLSQLYQLRGRVGRSNRLAYAYLTYRRDRVISETAQKRLAAIRDFTALGSGFKIAMRDLEIRGAGNLLGREQHGHIAAIGYDLYCKLLGEAVRESKGEKPELRTQTLIEIKTDAFIPKQYIPNEQQKLEMYKTIAAINSTKDLLETRDILIDRYGDIPKPVQNLLDIALLKGLAGQAGIDKISETDDYVQMRFGIAPDLERLSETVSQNPHFHIKADSFIILVVKKKDRSFVQDLIKILEKLTNHDK
ncbi:MAG TPA: transcription-repair coupling factor, partial [Clostridia bacterium]|nr:transcription-repair coupling factor [Clostridia bacterium]